MFLMQSNMMPRAKGALCPSGLIYTEGECIWKNFGSTTFVIEKNFTKRRDNVFLRRRTLVEIPNSVRINVMKFT